MHIRRLNSIHLILFNLNTPIGPIALILTDNQNIIQPFGHTYNSKWLNQIINEIISTIWYGKMATCKYNLLFKWDVLHILRGFKAWNLKVLRCNRLRRNPILWWRRRIFGSFIKFYDRLLLLSRFLSLLRIGCTRWILLCIIPESRFIVLVILSLTCKLLNVFDFGFYWLSL